MLDSASREYDEKLRNSHLTLVTKQSEEEIMILVFGVVISNTIIMLHYPHPKYNEWFFHLQIQVKIGGVQKNIAKIILYRVDPTKWRK